MFLTQKRLDRRTALKGIGVSVGLPLLEAMLPVRGAEARRMTGKRRFVAIEMVHGCAGSTAYGEKNNLWYPAEVGREFTFGKSSLAPLENYRQHLHRLVSRHRELTGSIWAQQILDEFRDYVGKFWLVKPKAASIESLADTLRRAA